MRKLLDDLEKWYGTDMAYMIDDNVLIQDAVLRIPLLLRHIRTLEKEHRAMRRWFELFASHPKVEPSGREMAIPVKLKNVARAILSSLTVRP